MPYGKDLRVDAYLDRLPDWQKKIQKINGLALLTMFRQIIANNRAGGWRKLKKEPSRSSLP